ncbi:helix-turn-helix domain-containing protein [Cupriavidus sp. IK-TO18]|uniref:helix-turn-helix domain-containing protein n=1 Tax=Cupriavidus sp. IK-TO18 TaxID=2782182 RepID=UPI00189B39DA|nr:helix-turn-helix domain-containing protein [Cupriavidus sp. IK-TO18]MBF6986756.1 helix-turn-helix domain-containing protein [Cupriavidus sp. IK-TO18]
MSITLTRQSDSAVAPIGTPLPGGDRRLTTQEAAEILGIKPHALDVWRCTDRYSLPYYRIGRRIYYKLSDVMSFLERCRRER